MDITIHPCALRGDVKVIPSKSQAHRLLICADFANHETYLVCPETNRDIEATADCLNSLGAKILRTADGYSIDPISVIPEKATLNCCESGSTLRFLLPIAGALGIDTVFQMEGRLPQRPLSPLKEEMERMGCQFSWVSSNELRLTGKLRPGDYYIDGGISSQFITGLLFASSLMEGDSAICITGRLESKPYVDMTLHAMARFGVKAENFHIPGGQQYLTPGEIVVEGDWSNGAFFLAAKQLGSNLTVMQLDENSPQGDRTVAQLLPKLKEFTTIDVSDIPDLVPILSVVASAGQGASFKNIQRLRLKESDRVASTIAMVENLGGKAQADENTLTIFGGGLVGGTVDACNDHRIAMATAIAATVCTKPVTILGAEAVNKSYPQFWAEYRRTGGNYELNLR